MKKHLKFVIINLVVLTLFVELGLRLQQALGPFYDLSISDLPYSDPSNLLNHVPRAGKQKLMLEVQPEGTKNGIEVFNVPVGILSRKRHSGMIYTVEHDANLIKLSSLRPSEGPSKLRVLFCGDSFMDGFDDANTVPQHVYNYFSHSHHANVNPLLWNAGHTSYSPVIFTAQAKHLVPKLKPDFVVISIDETDIGDDTIRYQKLVERDATGRIVAVRETPYYRAYNDALAKCAKRPLYLLRLVEKIYLTRVYFPKKWKEHERQFGVYDPLQIAKTEEAVAKAQYATEIEQFRKNLDELGATLRELLGGADRILFVRHPHLEHLKADAAGKTWNHIVRGVIAESAARQGIAFYDAEPDLVTAFGGSPEKFYFRNDMHFNFEGLKIYGNLVAAEIEKLVQSYLPASANLSSLNAQ